MVADYSVFIKQLVFFTSDMFVYLFQVSYTLPHKNLKIPRIIFKSMQYTMIQNMARLLDVILAVNIKLQGNFSRITVKIYMYISL